MPNFPPIRACLFDSDGLLINSEDIYSETINNILHEYGLPDIPWSIKAKQQSRGRQGFINVMDWAKFPISVDEFMAKVGAQREPFRKCKLLPGVQQLLQNLSRRDSPSVHLAIASSGDRDFFELKTEKFRDELSVIPENHRIFGNDATMSGCKGKPAPDIFLLMLERINGLLDAGEQKIRPEECLVFEDSTAGVEAGRAAGMRVLWIPHPGLLEVYKGREEEFLSGMLDEPEEIAEHAGHAGNVYGSKGRQAEFVTSLEDFPYENYGLGH